MAVGIIAFQGDVSEHTKTLAAFGEAVREIRSLNDCNDVTHVIIPGGESTVIARFLVESEVGEWMKEQSLHNTIAVFGTCAGAILLARNATGKNAPMPLQLIDITVDRNAYGTQRDSFEEDIVITGIEKPVHAAFIRAPRITEVGHAVEILATRESEPIIVKSGRILAATCHTEMRGDPALHQFFLSL